MEERPTSGPLGRQGYAPRTRTGAPPARSRALAGAVLASLVLALPACSEASSRPDGSEGSPPGVVSSDATARAASEAPPGSSANETTTSSSSSSRGPVEPARVRASVVASNLEAPWGLAFLPGGGALVTERDSARLLRIDASGAATEVQRIEAAPGGEGGLLGVALSPTYREDRLVYAYHSTGTDNRVVRFRLGEEPEPVLTGIPRGYRHNGGRIAFGPDGMLYVGTGDAGDTSTSQDLGSLGGKILRIAPDGAIPGDNPFADSPVYSYGHRNVQGLAWDAEGELYASEFGEDAADEVNRVRPGENYGWPEVEGEVGGSEYGPPVTTFAPSEASPSGAAILADGAIPQWEGDLFLAALRGERLWRLRLGEDGAVSGREALLEGELGRLRHVAQAPDGSLWVMTSNRDGRGAPAEDDDRILRLGPAGA